ncbi:Pr6Pr family membrane protein [Pseudohoeflea coraliihabitans]|uniref:Pr6Pr family membrane protein n=1 Tax=Pseudohoeflea coraliihabitans TaxID=2860393 RepID=A0ABS6WSB0_9HYPH|nr:Pr6Pr family membrane protein [Pseudohoeflea sp. DP4N28-3]MBW3098833.1 Pr6Pr family membrane protein [Pseudohoeflea sp. DP4N28-3]
MSNSRIARSLPWAGLVVGVAALGLQLFLTLPASLDAGRSLAGSIVFFLSFFTVLTNIGVVLTHAATLNFGGRLLAPLRTAPVRGGVAVAIAVVGIVYALVLAQTWQPEGLWHLADVLLHYVTPVLYLCWWLLSGRDGTLSVRHILIWLAWPAIYALYALARAPLAGEVPYPFLDYAAHGWLHVALSMLAIFGLFVVIGALVVVADRFSRNADPSARTTG